MATAPSPNDLTRQQLDELDALLQRMLSVPLPPDALPAAAPVAAARGAEIGTAVADPPLPPSWRVDPPVASRPPIAPAGGFGSGTREAPPFAAPAEPPSAVALRLEPQAVPAALAQTPAPAAPPRTNARAAPPAPLPHVNPTLPPAPAPAPPPTPAPTAVSQPPPKPAPAFAPAPTPASPPPAAPKASAALTPAPSLPPVPLPLLPFVALNTLFDNVCGSLGPVGRVLRSGRVKNLLGFVGLGLLVYTAAYVAQVRGWVTLPGRLPWPQ